MLSTGGTTAIGLYDFKKQLEDYSGKADKTYVDTSLSNLSATTNKYYSTLAAANADIANIALNQSVTIDEEANSGLWEKKTVGATSLTKSPYDPLRKSKEYTGQAVEDVASEIRKIQLSKTEDESDVVPVLVDADNKVLIGYNTAEDRIEAGGLQDQIFEKLQGVAKSSDTEKIAVLTDSANKILIGYDIGKDKAIIAGLEDLNLSNGSSSKPSVAEINHLLFYGQSLSVGATATTILSTTQPYQNLTFDTGPRMFDSTASGIKPLAEDALNPSPDGSSNRGETPCSGAANYASRALMLEEGVNPNDHVIFASTSGRGGYRVDQLEKGTAWYPKIINHVEKAKLLNVGKSYKVQAIPWVQGESDADSGTSYVIYRQKLENLQRDLEGEIRTIAGQDDGIPFICYQVSYKAQTQPQICLAQLDLIKNSKKFMMSTPIYHMPYASDALHLTNIGYKWLGAYVGRAYKQYITTGKKSEFINPMSAKVVGSTIEIIFDVPKAPLVIDTSTLAATTNHGFKVLNDAAALAISSISVSDSKVVIQLAETPSADIKVRYALDYRGDGLTLASGGSGNLRDSTTDTVSIAGVEKPLYHVCPHFELTAFIDKGI